MIFQSSDRFPKHLNNTLSPGGYPSGYAGLYILRGYSNELRQKIPHLIFDRQIIVNCLKENKPSKK